MERDVKKHAVDVTVTIIVVQNKSRECRENRTTTAGKVWNIG